MRVLTVSCLAAVMAAGTVLCLAQDAPHKPELPPPVEQHAWLQQLVGEWECDVEATMEPGKPPVRSKGSESVHSIGGFWVVSRIEGSCPMEGAPFSARLTLGYDPGKERYVGTWVDSMTSQLWIYEGTLDESGKTLTLEAEGPCPMTPGRRARFQEVITIQDRDHRTFTSSIQGEDGQWTTPLTVACRRTE